jgi:hypothetical protein
LATGISTTRLWRCTHATTTSHHLCCHDLPPARCISDLLSLLDPDPWPASEDEPRSLGWSCLASLACVKAKHSRSIETERGHDDIAVSTLILAFSSAPNATADGSAIVFTIPTCAQQYGTKALSTSRPTPTARAPERPDGTHLLNGRRAADYDLAEPCATPNGSVALSTQQKRDRHAHWEACIRKVHRTVSGSLISSGPLQCFLWYTGRLGPPRCGGLCQQQAGDSCEKRGLLATTACWPDPVGALQVRSSGRAWNASRSFVAWSATRSATQGRVHLSIGCIPALLTKQRGQ